MPVIGIPIPPPSSTSPLFVPLITTSPVTTQIYKKPVPGKMRGISARQCQQAQININLLDDNGNPVDLTQYGFPTSGTDSRYVIFAGIQEACELDNTGASWPGVVLTPTNGLVQMQTSSDIMCTPGVYIIEVGAFKDNGLILSNRFYLLVERGVFLTTSGMMSTPSGLPSLQEVRIALRDSPEGNRLTDEYEFDIAEICQALTMSILYWNNTPPILDMNYSTQSFPDRYNWLTGVCAYLLDIAAAYFRRQHLAYQGGGIAIDDLNKFQEYDAAAKAKHEAWERWVTMTKVGINMNQCFSTFGSPYGENWAIWQ